MAESTTMDKVLQVRCDGEFLEVVKRLVHYHGASNSSEAIRQTCIKYDRQVSRLQKSNDKEAISH